MPRSPARRPARLAAAGLAAAGLVLPLAGCAGPGGDGGGDRTLTVLAAASLTEVFGDLATTFEREHPGVDVRTSFGSSTDLAEQAADGAPGDVLATADPTAMQVATDAGVVTDPQTFATNSLVIVVPPGNPAGIRSLDDLAGTTWVRCADEVPCGRVAAAVLDDAGVDAEPASLEEDVKAALEKVTTGEADAALVYTTDGVAAGDAVRSIAVPGARREATSYLVGRLDQAADPDLARDWIDLVLSDQGQQALADAGFRGP